MEYLQTHTNPCAYSTHISHISHPHTHTSRSFSRSWMSFISIWALAKSFRNCCIFLLDRNTHRSTTTKKINCIKVQGSIEVKGDGEGGAWKVMNSVNLPERFYIVPLLLLTQLVSLFVTSSKYLMRVCVKRCRLWPVPNKKV